MALSTEAGSDPEYAAESAGIPLTDYLWALEYEKQRVDVFGYVEARGFFDATYDLACMLRSGPDTRHQLPAYKLVVCDELHDINEASFCIIESLLSVGITYFVGVGDKDQVIYTHLGADESFLQHRIASSFPDCVSFPLTMTYRHGPHLAYAMEAFKRKTVESNLPCARKSGSRRTRIARVPAEPRSSRPFFNGSRTANRWTAVASCCATRINP